MQSTRAQLQNVIARPGQDCLYVMNPLGTLCVLTLQNPCVVAGTVPQQPGSVLQLVDVGTWDMHSKTFRGATLRGEQHADDEGAAATPPRNPRRLRQSIIDTL